MGRHKVNIGIVGCGVIGVKRSNSIGSNKLVAVADIDSEKLKNIAYGITSIKRFTDWQSLVTLPEVDIVIVSTVNNMLAPITLGAINAGKHVLVEKPVALNTNDIRELIRATIQNNVKVKVGYSLRSHQALIKAKELVDSGTIGELMFIRGRYGHGGRLGYEKEWRSNPLLSGGGELIDQGIHLIDLSRLFLGEIKKTTGTIHTYFWDMEVEDNAFINLLSLKNQTAWLHVSCTEWKNMFSFEIYGKTGKIQIDGLGGSYGEEKLILYKMLPQMGPPTQQIFNFPSIDKSWSKEIEDLILSIKNNTPISPSLFDAHKNLKIIEEIYENKF